MHRWSRYDALKTTAFKAHFAELCYLYAYSIRSKVRCLVLRQAAHQLVPPQKFGGLLPLILHKGINVIYSCILALALTCALALSGCNKTLDFRNAEISHGKVYSAGSNDAFNGKVTNVPFDKLPTSPVYKFTTVISQALTGSFHAYSSVYGGYRGAFCDTHVSDGVVDGETSCRIAETGLPVFEFSYKDGQLNGNLTVFDLSKSGMKIASASFKNGQLEGVSEIYSPNTGKTVHKAIWNEGLANGVEEIFDERTGNLVSRASKTKGVYDGEVSRFSADGELVEKQTWQNGVRQQPSQSPASPGPNVEVCVDSWISAFRRENGADSVVTSDQMDEWESWCRAGKKPDVP